MCKTQDKENYTVIETVKFYKYYFIINIKKLFTTIQ